MASETLFQEIQRPRWLRGKVCVSRRKVSCSKPDSDEYPLRVSVWRNLNLMSICECRGAAPDVVLIIELLFKIKRFPQQTRFLRTSDSYGFNEDQADHWMDLSRINDSTVPNLKLRILLNLEIDAEFQTGVIKEKRIKTMNMAKTDAAD
ncbi:hypothetical protein AVEN_55934-1 [Araneus ventricosus]|uniref:Uncharacterized protein n=1 Tax=Araneus ventricosus TaxID=182803 RepID=A0A4Y2LWC9_ARAVE|nr:hypothetical protein AVEN_55934-1 [Araneus ventricosus]